MSDIIERWRHAKDLPLGFEISSLGNMRINYGDDKFVPMKLSTSDGYYVITVCGTTYAIHKLVAKTFIDNPNPDEYTLVEHIDKNKKNNSADNLRWTSRSEIALRGVKSEQSTAKRIRCVDTDQIFATLSSAEIYFNLPASVIKASIETGDKYYGHVFEYCDQIDENELADMIFISTKDLLEYGLELDSIDQLKAKLNL